jgi:hypothetical protein
MDWGSVYWAGGYKAMKTQAWGWLTAGVLALGLNGFYQAGGFAWAHQLASKVAHSANAVVALASGHANDFLTEARLLTTDRQSPSCPLATQLARVQTRMAVIHDRAQAQTDEGMARLEVMSAREQAESARLQASRELMQAQIEAQRDRWQAAFERANFKPVRFESMEINPVEFDSADCGAIKVQIPHVHVRTPRVRVPRIEVPQVRVPRIDVPQIRVDVGGAGPV